MNLTSKQKDDLHKALLGYLVQEKLTKAADAFAKEAKLTITDDMKNGKESTRTEEKLERKWRSVLRLEKKIAELTEGNAIIAEDIGCYGREGAVDESESLPEEQSHVLEMHAAPVTCVHFHPKFNIVVTASEDNTIVIWNAETGTFEGKVLKGHTDFVQCIAFNPSGTILASASNDTTVMLWDFGEEMNGTFKCLRTLSGHDNTVSCVTWNSTGEWIFTASRDKEIRKWETSTGHCKHTFKGHTEWVRWLTIGPEDKYMASCGDDQTVTVWDLSNGNMLTQMRDHDHVVLRVRFTNAKADRSIIDAILEEDDKRVALNKHKERQEALEGREDKGGMFLISCSRDNTIRLWFISEGVCVRTFNGHENWVRDVQFHPSGRYFMSCSDDNSIRVWDMKKFGRVCVRFDNAHESFVQCLDWNKHTPMLATGGVKHEVKLWSCSSKRR